MTTTSGAEHFDKTLVLAYEVIRRVLISRLGRQEFVFEATDSACRTFLCRIREGELVLDVPDAIASFLIQTPISKAYKLRRGIGRRLEQDFAGTASSPSQETTRGEEEIRAATSCT